MMVSERRDFNDEEQSRMMVALLEDGLSLHDIRTFFPWIIRDQHQWWTDVWPTTVTSYYTLPDGTSTLD